MLQELKLINYDYFIDPSYYELADIDDKLSRKLFLVKFENT